MITILFFIVSFSILLFVYRSRTTNKHALAVNFAIIYIVIYGFNLTMGPKNPTTWSMIIAFPLLAYLLTLFFVKNNGNHPPVSQDSI